MNFDMDRVDESKRAMRKRLAALPIAEKLRMLDMLRERTLAIQSASLSPTRNVHGSEVRGAGESSQAAKEGMMSLNDHSLVEIDSEKLGGTPVFYGTRVPIQNLFDCIEEGETLDQFLDQFPTVSREQALAVLEASKERLLNSYESAA